MKVTTRKKKVDPAELELEFKALVESVGEEIEAKLKQAKALVREAEKLSDKYGIPFFSSVSILGENYIPESFQQKFRALKPEDVADITGVPAEEIAQSYSTGWNHSAVC